MQIRFVKNIQFTKLVKADGRLREFNFRKMKGPEEELFSVDVVDDRGNRIIFQMRKENGGWRMTEQQLPGWILAQESILNEQIEEELRNN
ncbi:hypothetical protein [Foetidibacter luteolus]|uniref:hypothetical protein n=1 Tax=Foetidibacter luteolus TaxID=2608880 RepID=UPI00129A8F9F|nr:hypothetical protein [Foetidibacter luteolus]